MGEILLKTCDILGRKATAAKPVYKVQIIVMEQPGGEGGGWVNRHTTGDTDMCPDAIKRAIKFAERAVSPPNVAATKAVED